jgi:hypothetical protein
MCARCCCVGPHTCPLLRRPGRSSHTGASVDNRGGPGIFRSSPRPSTVRTSPAPGPEGGTTKTTNRARVRAKVCGANKGYPRSTAHNPAKTCMHRRRQPSAHRLGRRSVAGPLAIVALPRLWLGRPREESPAHHRPAHNTMRFVMPALCAVKLAASLMPCQFDAAGSRRPRRMSCARRASHRTVVNAIARELQ